MPKIKRKRSERVNALPNVVIEDHNTGLNGVEPIYPWCTSAYSNMKTILELGCGKGEHSLGFAAADPNCLCIGVDLKSHRLCVGAEKAIKNGLNNIFFFRARIEEISTFFPAGAVHEIWLTFPDPHPKQRGIKHRLSASHFLNQYARLLVPGGQVHLKTDSPLLYTYTRESVDYWGGRVLEETQDLYSENGIGKKARQTVSAFESKALEKDKPIRYLAFTLNDPLPEGT